MPPEPNIQWVYNVPCYFYFFCMTHKLHDPTSKYFSRSKKSSTKHIHLLQATILVILRYYTYFFTRHIKSLYSVPVICPPIVIHNTAYVNEIYCILFYFIPSIFKHAYQDKKIKLAIKTLKCYYYHSWITYQANTWYNWIFEHMIKLTNLAFTTSIKI